MTQMHYPERVNGLPVIARATIPLRSGMRPCEVILVERRSITDPRPEWVTAIRSFDRPGEDGWFQGHYFETLDAAFADFRERCQRNGC